GGGVDASWHCDACGFSRPARVQTDGRGPPRGDDDEQLEEARRALAIAGEAEGEPEQEPAPEIPGANGTLKTEPEPEPELRAPTIADATKLRCELVAAGYLPIPLFGKHPALENWSNLTSATDAMIVMWAKTWPDATNTGILTRNVPTLDLDILNEEAVRACEDLVRKHCEEGGYVLVRIGQPPKRAIPFRTDEPFAKILVNLIAPNATADAKPEKIEFLGNGQQVVVAGIHPDTRRPYRWHGSEPGAVKREDLPYTREVEARELVDKLLALLAQDFGYTTTRARPSKASGGDGHDRGGGPDDWQYLLDNIHAGRELHDSLRDLAAKMIRAGTSGGAVVNFLRAEMQRSSAPHDERWRERYGEIPRLVKGAEERFAEDEPPQKAPPPGQPRPQEGDPQPSLIEKTLAVYEHWLILPSRTPVYAMLGAAAANYLEGDPVWLGLIGPPSSAKTELLISTRALPEVALSATITEAGLLSGTPKKQYNKGAKGGLLREIGAFGILVLKDFGSILSM